MISNKNKLYRSLELKDLQSIAILHQKAFQDSALTKLGLEPVRRYYEWQLTGPHDCYAIGAFSADDELTGSGRRSGSLQVP